MTALARGQGANIAEADTRPVEAWIKERQRLLFPLDEEKSYNTNSSHCTCHQQREDMHFKGFLALGERESQNPDVRELLARAETYFLLAYAFSGVLNECFREPAERRHRLDKWHHNPSMALSHHFENAVCTRQESLADRCGRFLTIERLAADEHVQKVFTEWRALKEKTPDVPWDKDYQSLDKHQIDWARMLPVLKDAKDQTARRVYRFIHWAQLGQD